MVAQRNGNGAGMQAPPTPGQQQPIKAAGAAAAASSGGQQHMSGNPTSPKIPAATQSSEVLHGTRKMPICPVKMGIAGFGVIATIAYFTLYSHKKPEASALDVARVASNNQPRK